MKTFHLRVFQKQLLDQCKFLLMAAEGVNAGLKNKDPREILFNIQNLLNAGANISKMLWGQKGKHAVSRKPLRDSIGVSDASPLREVTMRNHFEHMDERIDRWWAESAHHNFLDKMIAPKNSIHGPAPIDMFRMFDPTTCDVVFWGQDFNVQALVDEVQKIIPALEVEAAKPHWD